MSHSPKAVLYISRLFADMQFLSLDPGALSAYSLTSPTPRMGEQGDGFAGLIKYLEGQASDLAALTEWLKELRPDEVESLYTVKAPAGEYMAAIKERGWEFLAPTLSEGTLRFIALAAAFFQPSMPKVLVIEEIEKGLHPSRLRLLLDLMRSQSKRTGTQVFATTHSPTLLAWLTEEDRKTTFVCTRDAESGATKMRSLAEIPRFEELIQEGSHIDELFAEGWLESAPQ
jgi:predicted ATPase